MEKTIDPKSVVKKKYSEVVNESCGCCAPTARSKMDTSFSMAEDYSNLAGYNPDADYSLGCGVPTKHAEINSGDTVVDLGSGAGNDVFIVQNIVGSSGLVIGLDMTQDMVDKANLNKQKLGLENVDFILGDIEAMPIDDNQADVVISNCVLNLVPDKQKAFAEIYRTTKRGGHFCISDIVSEGRIPESLKASAELYAGCVAGALPKEEYLDFVRQAGFVNLQIRQERNIDVPEQVVREVLTEEEWKTWEKSGTGLVSITLYAEKPAS
ncbi:MAG: arsenite methyltransferase [Candidatus Marinimicrobia bacterium]|jgi:ubiquinone/menaquinone biosynthesis C-methylase UbiE|nr:arsenite methyltransferase [Candidatus Neomarinimicrobiota bacterium]MBT3630105.1 arsenite methyltransferase [Candidatus Neomarinimicrobiota bacterium]MBT3826057.1 arsenite methyltransferase [Candidatus Neomarinimicrobiota bacterium]MBT4132091.1 arsenite methyltransferase [Candidatus Neomarinimicrobiota bacterium]MBT4296578.1 arsenite methyltransferase [Candidatus Neomarinimicrobiota bacterium]